MKEHANGSRFKTRQVAVVKPITRTFPLTSTPSPQKTTSHLTKQPKIILKDILAKEHYIAGEYDQFTCPICAKSYKSTSMVNHLHKSHKPVAKLIKPRVKCADCSALVNPNQLKYHKRKQCKGETKTHLALCDASVRGHQSLRQLLQREQAAWWSFSSSFVKICR